MCTCVTAYVYVCVCAFVSLLITMCVTAYHCVCHLLIAYLCVSLCVYVCICVYRSLRACTSSFLTNSTTGIVISLMCDNSVLLFCCVFLDCPDEPINVQIFNVNSRNLTINWTEPHANNDPITQYSISYQNPDCLVDANNVTQNVTVTSMEEQVTINNLHPGEYYTFTIIAINDICPSQPSLPASMRTEEEGML